MILVCKVEQDDEFTVANSEELNINKNSDFTYTFWNDLRSLPNFYSQEGLDLLYLSFFVFAADRKFARQNSNDSWSRNIELYIPVLSLSKWKDLKDKAEKMLSFLSGDRWVLHFRERILTTKETKISEKMKKSEQKKDDFAVLCMFSGGLDSFIGAIDLLEEANKPILFISHYGGGKGTKEYQDVLKDKLVDNYSINERNFYQNYAAVKNGKENTTRTRSFMFFAHAITFASAMEKEVTLVIPENGLISLNIPLTFTRLGTSSTRTTHPYYIRLLQELVLSLGIKVQIKNPYQFKTKGEMILECKNRIFLQENIINTMSCSHPDVGRHRGESETCHCGYCFPCIIRKAAILRGNMEDSSRYFDEHFVSGPTAKRNLNTYGLSITKFNPAHAFLRIQCSGPIQDNIEQYTELYVRGMGELSKYLEEKNV